MVTVGGTGGCFINVGGSFGAAGAGGAGATGAAAGTAISASAAVCEGFFFAAERFFFDAERPASRVAVGARRDGGARGGLVGLARRAGPGARRR